MIDLLVDAEGRDVFTAKAESRAGDPSDGVGDVAASLSLARSPVAILFCVHGRYVKASPEMLRADDNSGDPSNAYHQQIHTMFCKRHKEHLKEQASDAKMKDDHYTAIEVSTHEAEPCE
jgi:hypothetical protein